MIGTGTIHAHASTILRHLFVPMWSDHVSDDRRRSHAGIRHSVEVFPLGRGRTRHRPTITTPRIIMATQVRLGLSDRAATVAHITDGDTKGGTARLCGCLRADVEMHGVWARGPAWNPETISRYE